MELATAIKNCAVLKYIKENEKLIVGKNQELHVDARWLKGLRHSNSRQNIVQPIHQTFLLLFGTNVYSYEQIDKIVKELIRIFKVTYPDYKALADTLNDILEENDMRHKTHLALKNTKVILVQEYEEDPDDDIQHQSCCFRWQRK